MVLQEQQNINPVAQIYSKLQLITIPDLIMLEIHYYQGILQCLMILCMSTVASLNYLIIFEVLRDYKLKKKKCYEKVI